MKHFGALCKKIVNFYSIGLLFSLNESRVKIDQGGIDFVVVEEKEQPEKSLGTTYFLITNTGESIYISFPPGIPCGLNDLKRNSIDEVNCVVAPYNV